MTLTMIVMALVCAQSGLMNPNAYLAVAIEYLAQHRAQWPKDIQLEKPWCPSGMIDRVVMALVADFAKCPSALSGYVEGMFEGSMALGAKRVQGLLST